MTYPENIRANGLTDKDLEKLRNEYESALPNTRRAMEIRDLGYPLNTQDNKYLPLEKDYSWCG